MAIFSSVPPPGQQATLVSQSTNANLASGLAALAISPSTTSSRGVALSIPLDAEAEALKAAKARKEPLRRDSLKRREALLKGKEGSRRRQRWENDRFMHVPNAQPPLPSDWEVHPTYPVHSVPYYLAPLWDLRNEVKATHSRNSSSAIKTKARDDQKGRIPRELKAKLKRSKGAKTLLQELEEEVRKFVREHERQQRFPNKVGDSEPEMDSEDEDIVFVGRNGQMSDEIKKQREMAERFLQREKKIWEGDANDRGSGFGRWLVHSIAEYYGLSSRSVTVGNPARREAYVGIKAPEMKMKGGPRVSSSALQEELPRPLYGLV
ncbi:R3H-associated N-terminal domain-containing protein [Amylocarpus encephaloides]|uniref:R3H-associated N-terminal domain-containing protein n=1 Tax=Amylocarpus encephaloides TaxID=45428 RepID=A0A9P7Y6E2_9HELO|nr:R3H-associated N-terminal domain-containing protein [Amylocarpus encephaloides]